MSFPRVFAVVGALLLAACGGGGASPPTTPAPSNSNPFTITMTASGVQPRELTVPPGTRVLFINNDRRRNMTADPHPEHNEAGCEGINNVGLISPGQQKETGNMTVVKTCGFHDHDDPGNTTVQGRITVRP
jgi:hypothetical protein